MLKFLKIYFSLKKSLLIFIKRLKTPKIIKKYFDKNNVRKLHLGCGGKIFSGWLNCDINLQSDCYLDLNKKLPFLDNSVDYIYSEHVIEHFSYGQAEKILSECYRVLKLNGVIRTAMPSLDFYLENISSQDPEIMDFIIWHQNNFPELKNMPANMNSMLNFITASCGHKYVYNKKTFIDLLVDLNFKNARQVELSELENNIMSRAGGIKNHLMQTIVFEAEK